MRPILFIGGAFFAGLALLLASLALYRSYEISVQSPSHGKKVGRLTFSEEGFKLFTELLHMTSYEAKKPPGQWLVDATSHLESKSCPLDERLTLLFWLCLTRQFVPSKLVQEILEASESSASSLDWDFVRARIAVMYSHPRVGAYLPEVFLPLAEKFALRSIGLSSSDALDPKALKEKLEDVPLLYFLYAVGVVYLVEEYFPDKDFSSSARQATEGRSSLSLLLSARPSLVDKYFRLPPPWLDAFYSFSDLPKELSLLPESDFPWEKIDNYSLIIASRYSENALRELELGNPSSLYGLILLQLYFMSLDPPTVYTFLPSVEGVDVLLDRMKRQLDEKNLTSSFGETSAKPSANTLTHSPGKKSKISLEKLSQSIKDFKELKKRLKDTSGLALEKLEYHWFSGGSSRVLFESIYRDLRPGFAELTASLLEELEA